MTRVFVRLETSLLRVYQAWSATRPLRCRYVPTCSSYAVEALRTQRFFYANWLILRRLLRCQPWGGWGSDPVPVSTISTSHPLSQGINPS